MEDRPAVPKKVWNRPTQEEREYVVRYALEHHSLTPREIASRLVDMEGRFVSESTVYRPLKEAGLIKPTETRGFMAGKEYHTKTTGPNQLWQTDACYLFVVGWCLISVLITQG